MIKARDKINMVMDQLNNSFLMFPDESEIDEQLQAELCEVMRHTRRAIVRLRKILQEEIREVNDE